MITVISKCGPGFTFQTTHLYDSTLGTKNRLSAGRHQNTFGDYRLWFTMFLTDIIRLGEYIPGLCISQMLFVGEGHLLEPPK